MGFQTFKIYPVCHICVWNRNIEAFKQQRYHIWFDITLKIYWFVINAIAYQQITHDAAVQFCTA